MVDLTVDDPEGGTPFHTSILHTVGASLSLSQGAELWLAPDTFLEPLDAQQVSAVAVEDGGASWRVAEAWIGAPEPPDLTLPATLVAPPAYGTVEGAYARVFVDVEAEPGARLYGLSVATSPSASTFYSDYVSEGWRSRTGAATLGMPDLSGEAGWDRAWETPADEVLGWRYRVVQGEGDLSPLFSALRYQGAVDGARDVRVQWAERVGQIQP